LLRDFYWLLHQGHVVDYAVKGLEIPRRQPAKPPTPPKSKPAAAVVEPPAPPAEAQLPPPADSPATENPLPQTGE